MKKLFILSTLLLLVFTFVQCTESNDDSSQDATESTIIGRWKIVGFENIQYEFTANKRFDIYGAEGETFPTLEEFQQGNPGLTGLDWEYEGETVVVDLNFGNYSRLVPNFKCDNKVIDWINEVDATHTTYYRVNHDISSCN